MYYLNFRNLLVEQFLWTSILFRKGFQPSGHIVSTTLFYAFLVYGYVANAIFVAKFHCR